MNQLTEEQQIRQEAVCRFCDQGIYLAGDEWRHCFNESLLCRPTTATPLLDGDSQPLGDAVCLYVPPIDATELHRALLCRDCGKPFGEHRQPPVTAPLEAPLRYWVELRSQHAFSVRPQPFVETVEYVRFDLARTSAVPRVDQVKPGEM